ELSLSSASTGRLIALRAAAFGSLTKVSLLARCDETRPTNYFERRAAAETFSERRLDLLFGRLPAFIWRAMRFCSVSCLIFFQSSILLCAPFHGLSRMFSLVREGDQDTPGP
ncbi:MAG: hypothetical protein P8Z79_15755, partial [Sedimentisphaerales bacterium]